MGSAQVSFPTVELDTQRGGTDTFREAADNKSTPFPGMTMSNYMDTTHFGGSLQTDPYLPKNYVAVTSHVDASKMNLAARILYQRLEEGALPSCIADFTFVLEGHEADELPERALGTIRMVHVDPVKVALPTFYSASRHPWRVTSQLPLRATQPIRQHRQRGSGNSLRAGKIG